MPVTSLTAISSAPSDAAASKSPQHDGHDPARVQGDRQRGQRARGAGELDVPGAQPGPALEVPESEGGASSSACPSAASSSVATSSSQERLAAPAAGRARRGAPVGDQGRQAVEEQVARPRIVQRLRGGACRRGRPRASAARLGQPTGDQGRAPGVEVGLAREPHVERLEPPGGLQQQQRRLAARAGGPSISARELLDAGPLQVVDRGRPRPRPAARGRRRTRRRAGARAPRPARGRRAGPGSAVSADRHAGGTPPRPASPARAWAAPPARSSSRGDVLVRPGRRGGQVPDPALRIELGIGRLGQRQVRGAAILGRAAPRTRPIAPADGGTGPGSRSRAAARRRPAPAASRPRPSVCAARHSSVASPVGSAAASSISRCVGSGQRPHPARVAGPAS